MPARVARVLVDHCVIVHGQTTRLVSVKETVNWGPTTASLAVTRIQGKRLEKGADWLRNERRALVAVGNAAREGLMVPYTSMELGAERLKARMGGRDIRGDLWSGVRFQHASGPLDRSTWMGSLSLEQIGSKTHRDEFYDRLLRFARDGIPQQFLDSLPCTEFIEAQKRNLGRLSEFLGLCEVVGKRRRGDAFHYWTALCSDLDYFLTTDKAFLLALRGHADKELIDRAVSPSELVRIMGLPPVALPIEENEIVPFATH